MIIPELVCMVLIATPFVLGIVLAILVGDPLKHNGQRYDKILKKLREDG